jgi:hypothetical protein
MLTWLLIAVGAIVLLRKFSSRAGDSRMTLTSYSGGGYRKDVVGGAPAPQPAVGEIIAVPSKLPTASELQGETADEVPVNKSEPLGVYYKI